MALSFSAGMSGDLKVSLYSVIQGYKAIWTPTMGEEISMAKLPQNTKRSALIISVVFNRRLAL